MAGNIDSPPIRWNVGETQGRRPDGSSISLPIDISEDESAPVIHRLGVAAFGNSVAEQTIYSYEIPGGGLGSTGAYNLTLAGNFLHNAGGNVKTTLRIKYGSTTMFGDITGNIGSNSSRRAWRCSVFLFANGSEDSQRVNARFAMGAVTSGSVAGAGNIAGSDTIIASLLAGEASEDSTGPLDFQVTFEHNTADPEVEIVRTFAWLQKLN